MSLRRPCASAFRRPRPVVYRKSGVDCNLPPEPAAKIPESARVLGAEDDFVFRLKRNNEILAIAPHRYLSPVFHATLPLLYAPCICPPHRPARPLADVIHHIVLRRCVAALPPVLFPFSIAIDGSFVTGLCPRGGRAVSSRSPGGSRLVTHSPQVHLRPD